MNNRDRRPVLYAAVGAIILVLAFFLFRPPSGDDDMPDTLVLTPEGVEDPALQAAVDESEAAETSGELEQAETAAEKIEDDPFPVEDAKLETAEVATPKKRAAQPVQVAAATPSLGGDYYLVVGSYEDPNNAQRLVQRLDSSGIAAEIESGNGPKGALHRVRVGYFPDHGRAETYGRKLQKDMNLDFWVAHK